MRSQNPTGAVRIAGHPIHPMLAMFPIAFFAATLVTDVTYWRTADPLWTTMSSWLLLAGLVMAYAAILPGLVDFVADRGVRRLRSAWIHMLGSGLAVLLSSLNFLFHVRDGYSAVAPVGVVLSAAVVLILLFTGGMGAGFVDRNGVGLVEAAGAGSKEA